MNNLKAFTISFLGFSLLWLGILGLVHSRPVHAQAPPAAAGQKAYINTAATTIVKPSNAFLHTVTINSNTTAGTVTLFDIAPSGCTGTPASGKFATITATATAVPVTLTYDVVAINGLCALTSQATDLTVSFN